MGKFITVHEIGGYNIHGEVIKDYLIPRIINTEEILDIHEGCSHEWFYEKRNYGTIIKLKKLDFVHKTGYSIYNSHINTPRPAIPYHDIDVSTFSYHNDTNKYNYFTILVNESVEEIAKMLN